MALLVETTPPEGVLIVTPPRHGDAHGFVTRAPDTEVLYKCSAHCAPASEGVLRWNDPAIGIDWGLGGTAPVIAPRDATAPLFADLGQPFPAGSR